MKGKRYLFVILLLCSLLLICGCASKDNDSFYTTAGAMTANTKPASTQTAGTTTPQVGTTATVLPSQQEDLFFGVAEPLLARITDKEVSLEASMAALKELGVTSIRLWMDNIVASPTQVNSANVTRMNKILDACKEENITVIGMISSWNVEGTYRGMYDISDDPNSPYMKWMTEFWAKMIEKYVETFPDILYWEINNETNGDGFLHKIGYQDNEELVFTFEEKAHITTDMMYYATQAVRQKNPKAKTIMPPPSPVASDEYYGFENGVIESFIELLYKNIESGKWPSTDPDDFFDIVSWHPYYLVSSWKEIAIDDEWININKAIYNVMVEHNDGDKPVFFTEFGYSDSGDSNADKEQAQWLKNAIIRTKNELPFVKMFGVFRLFDSPKDASWGGDYQVYFGNYHVNKIDKTTYELEIKEKGKAVKEAYQQLKNN